MSQRGHENNWSIVKVLVLSVICNGLKGSSRNARSLERTYFPVWYKTNNKKNFLAKKKKEEHKHFNRIILYI